MTDATTTRWVISDAEGGTSTIYCRWLPGRREQRVREAVAFLKTLLVTAFICWGGVAIVVALATHLLGPP